MADVERADDAARGKRPLSPHITIYRPQLTSVTSILTRITGNALIVALLLIVWWLMAAATSPTAFGWANAVITSWFGNLVMVLSLWALWYHTLAGIRHMIWDTVAMLEMKQAELLGWLCVGGSFMLTFLTIIIIC